MHLDQNGNVIGTIATGELWYQFLVELRLIHKDIATYQNKQKAVALPPTTLPNVGRGPPPTGHIHPRSLPYVAVNIHSIGERAIPRALKDIGASVEVGITIIKFRRIDMATLTQKPGESFRDFQTRVINAYKAAKAAKEPKKPTLKVVKWVNIYQLSYSWE